MARIRLEIDGKAEFDRAFRRVGFVMDDLTPIWDDVRDAFWEIEKRQFASEGSAGRSGKWKPLSKRYAIEKIKRYGAKPILERTGRLVKAMTGQTADTVYQKDSKNMAVGTNLPYAARHQRGAGKLPQREIISFNEASRNFMQKQIQKGFVREMRRGGLYPD